jgi:ABC-2 type transport system permease protein
MRAIIYIALKDIRLLSRDFFGMFWVIFFPLIMALFFGSIFGFGGSSARSLKVAYVAESGIPDSSDFYTELSKSEVLKLTPMSYDSARAEVARGDLIGYIKYTAPKSDNYEDMFAQDRPPIEIGIDPSRKAEKGFLEGIITQAYFVSMQKKFTDINFMKKSLGQQLAEIDTSSQVPDNMKPTMKSLYGNLNGFFDDMIKLDSVADSSNKAKDYSPFGKPNIDFVEITNNANLPHSSFEITFPQALQWALLGCVAAFALGLVVEQTRGTYVRLRLAPLSRAQILAGKGLACFASCIAVCLVLMLFGAVVFGVRIVNPVGLLLALLASATCFTGIMMLVSVIGRTEQAVGGAGWAIFLVMAMTGGAMVPLFVMPSWLRSIGSVSPIKWSVLAFEGAIWRGFGIAEMALPLIILVSVGMVLFSVGVMILIKRES